MNISYFTCRKLRMKKNDEFNTTWRDSTLLKTLAQAALSVILIMKGWDIAYRFHPPKGSNWMWIFQMELYLAVLLFLIVLGNIVIASRGHRTAIFWTQLVLIFLMCADMFSIHPLRSTFLFVCSSIALTTGHWIFEV